MHWLAGFVVVVVVAVYGDVTDVERWMTKIPSIVSWRTHNEAYNVDLSVKHGDHDHTCFPYSYKKFIMGRCSVFDETDRFILHLR